jgi:signal transduction histidine kinase
MWLDVKNHKQRIYHEFDNVELRTVYRDKKGNLWLGSYGQGYFLFRNGRFTKMPEDEAHHLKIVHCFLEDRKGFIWMTTNNGLFQCAVNDLYGYASGRIGQVYHQYYGKESGLKTTEFNGGCNPSGLKLANGTFAFPSMNGVVLFHPDSIKPASPASKLFIEQVLLDGKPANGPQLLQIAPSFKRLELTVSSPYFGHPNNLGIRYNVEGLDDHWYPLGENNRIVLNTLNYGRYKLRLRKEAGFGSGNYITTELPLLVIPFFYQTWWFYILIVAGIISTIAVIIKMRYRYLVHQRNRLETEVKDRTRELAYHSRLMEKLTLMIAHDLKSPLYFLSKVTGHLRQNVQQENLQGIDRTSNEIKNTADQVYQFIEEFNLWASSFTEGFIVSKISFPLDGLLQELGLFFREMLEANGNRLLLLTSAHYILNTDRELLKMILRNIIDNANKHARDCDISISVSTETDGYIAITVADTGEGMSEPILKRIHDRIAQASTAAGIERNSRLGYQMIIDFATRLEAKLEVQSERGKGTSVTLRIQGRVIGTTLSQDLVKQIISTG